MFLIRFTNLKICNHDPDASKHSGIEVVICYTDWIDYCYCWVNCCDVRENALLKSQQIWTYRVSIRARKTKRILYEFCKINSEEWFKCIWPTHIIVAKWKSRNIGLDIECLVKSYFKMFVICNKNDSRIWCSCNWWVTSFVTYG